LGKSFYPTSQRGQAATKRIYARFSNKLKTGALSGGKQFQKNFPTDKSGQRIKNLYRIIARMITSQNKSNTIQEIILTRIILPFNPLAAVIRWSSSISWGIKLSEFFSEFGCISTQRGQATTKQEKT
jgi:hypothetical protein